LPQCQGTTKKGDQCKRDAQEGSSFCAIHVDQAVRARSAPTSVDWDRDSMLKAAIGFAAVGAILFFRLRR